MPRPASAPRTSSGVLSIWGLSRGRSGARIPTLVSRFPFGCACRDGHPQIRPFCATARKNRYAVQFRSHPDQWNRRQPGRHWSARHRRARRAHRGDRRLAPARGRRGVRRRGLTCCPASSTPRCIFASRAWSGRKTWRRGSRAAVLGGVTAVFEMPNTDPMTTERRGARRQDRPRDGPHALRPRLLRRRHARKHRGRSPSSSGCPAAAAIKVFMGSSTGALLVADDACICASPEPRAAGASRSTPRTRRA